MNNNPGVMAGGVGGFFAAGPVGAFAGGVAAGTAIDTAYSVATDQDHGIYAALDRIEKDDHKASALFDLARIVTMDGFCGQSAGQMAGRIAGKLSNYPKNEPPKMKLTFDD